MATLCPPETRRALNPEGTTERPRPTPWAHQNESRSAGSTPHSCLALAARFKIKIENAKMATPQRDMITQFFNFTILHRCARYTCIPDTHNYSTILLYLYSTTIARNLRVLRVYE